MVQNEKLTELIKARVCDEQTALALDTIDPFIITQVDDIHKDFFKETEEAQELEYKRYTYGSKLLFLEEFIKSSIETQALVKEWLQDPKRSHLFKKSDQADLYGELLLAKVNDTLNQLRLEYNPNAKPQPTFSFNKELKMVYNPETVETTLENQQKLLEEKVNAVIGVIKKKHYDEMLSGFENLLSEESITDCLYCNERGNIQNPISLFAEKLANGYPNFYLMIEEHFKDLVYDVPSKSNKTREYIQQKLIQIKKKLEREYERTIHPKLQKLKNYVLDKDFCFNYKFYSCDKKFSDLVQFFRINRNERRELEQIILQNDEISELSDNARRLGSKLDKPKILTYFVELSKKDPLDVRIGNDSGCCIGIYEKTDDLGNGYCLPHFIADNATYIFDINQQINGNKKRRVGIVLAFDVVDEKGNKILACNSIELSPTMNPISHVNSIVSFVEESLIEFGRQNHYRGVIMSSHSYNTSYNYSKRKNEKIKTMGCLKKVRTENERDFYSEIIPIMGLIRDLSDIYCLYDSRI